MCHLWRRTGALTSYTVCQCLDLGLSDSRPVRNKFLLFIMLGLKTLWCQKQTHKRQRKSWQRDFFWSKGFKHVLTPAKQTYEHKIALYLWCTCTCPSPGICLGQKFTIPLDWLKGLGDGLGYVIWQTIFMGNRTVQEGRRRNKNPLNNLSHLRWWPEEF
jgi:hypothetical protein